MLLSFFNTIINKKALRAVKKDLNIQLL